LGHPDKGNKCPMHAHIRKVNPRGDVVDLFNTSPSAERDHIMPRRGITYGRRKLGKNGFKDTDQPSKGVGLLFMAYNADIDSQFEFVQEAWMNQPDFVQSGTGTDPVAGQGGGIGFPQSWPTAWGGTGRKSFSFGGFVTMRGGEYFFAPSLAFIAAL
jgi:deferrochelatase/peroxidase EfeB